MLLIFLVTSVFTFNLDSVRIDSATLFEINEKLLLEETILNCTDLLHVPTQQTSLKLQDKCFLINQTTNIDVSELSLVNCNIFLNTNPDANSSTQLYITALNITFYNVSIISQPHNPQTNAIFDEPIPELQIQSTYINAYEVAFLLENALFLSAEQLISFQKSILLGSQVGVTASSFIFITSKMISTRMKCKSILSCKENVPSKSPRDFMSYRSLLLNLEPFQSIQLGQEKPFDMILGFLAYNYSIVCVVQQYLNLIHGSYIYGTYIGLYSTNLEIDSDSVVSAKGGGCAPNMGQGCGFLDWLTGFRQQCGGTGASHGGKGGGSISPARSFIPICLQMSSRPIYDNIFNPIYEGSGGGSGIQGISYGGGVVYIEVAHQFVHQGVIDVSGVSGNSNGFDGGASGGSVQISTLILTGQGVINASGSGPSDGSSSTGYSGVGGGGRIKINLTQWYNQNWQISPAQTALNLSNVTVNVGPGTPFINMAYLVTYQQTGTIYTTPCLPGYGIGSNGNPYLCTPCAPKQYKAIISNTQCQQCPLIDSNAVYKSQQTTPQCEIQNCNSNYILWKGKRCVSPLQKFVLEIHGDNVFYLIGVSLVLLVISLFIIFMKRNSNRRRKPLTDAQSMFKSMDPHSLISRKEESSATPQFITEDLPYYVKRIYLQGSNLKGDYWQFYKDSENAFFLRERDNTELIDGLVSFNHHSKFNSFQTCLLVFFSYFYFPVEFLLLKFFQNRKYQQLQSFLMQRKADMVCTNDTGCFFKFSCSQDRTLAFVDILNYNRDILSWTNQIQFPLSLVLAGCGTFLFPYNIYVKDPLLKSFLSQYQEQDEELKLEQFLINFNSKAKLIDYNQESAVFAQIFINLIRFVEEHNDDILRNMNLNAELCLHILCEDSKVIMLSSDNLAELEICLVDVHKLFHQGTAIKITINFDKLQEKLFSEQVVLPSKEDINIQIDQFKKYEIENEEFHLLKQKMQRKIEEGDKFRRYYRESSHYATLLNEMNKTKKNKTLRGIQVFLTTFFRYRNARITPRLLLSLFFILVIAEWVLLFVYPVLLYLSFDSNVVIIEMLIQAIIFPFSLILSPLFLTIWLITSHNDIGKSFLQFNYSGIVTSIITFSVSFSLFSQGSNIVYLDLLKTLQILIMSLLSYLACIQLNVSDDYDHDHNK